MHAIARLTTTALLALAATAATGAEPKKPVFEMSSTSFPDNGLMANRFSGSPSARGSDANCLGENVSPAMSWRNPPAGTKSFAITMGDSEGKAGLGANHLTIYGIAAATTGFKEGELSQPSDKYVGGKSMMGTGIYTGPCTRPGAAHHYMFTLIATDLEPGALPAGLDQDELLKALKGHALAAVGMVGRSKHP